MISKKHFLEQIQKLMQIFDEQISDERVKLYYETLTADFTDEQFDKALNYALKTSFKFPPIAAFYKVDPAAPEEKKAYEPCTPEETAIIREVRRRNGLD